LPDATFRYYPVLCTAGKMKIVTRPGLPVFFVLVIGEEFIELIRLNLG
jgi:hypothetical protein